MLRTRLLTASAAIALFAAPAAFAQDPMTPAPAPQTPPTTAPAPTPAMPAAQTPAPTTPQAAPAATPATPTTAEATTPVAGGTVIDVLKSNGQFNTLLAALDAAQLTQTLTTQPAVSIFAPTDAAFAALPEADRTRLMDPANVNELRQLLLYHVVVADVNSSQIKGAKGGVATASNAQVQLDGTADALKVDDATIVQADIDASNGAIFAIDKVLSPANSQAAAGDEEAAPVAAPADDAETTTGDEATEADTTEDEAVTPPAATGTETAPAAPGVVRPTDSSMAPAGAPAGDTTTTTTAQPSTAPTGQTAPTTTTVASPPIVSPTDGQQDGGDEDDAPAPTPTPQS